MSTADTRVFGSPAHRWIGIEPGSRSSAHAEARLAVRPEFLQEEGVVHGGILATLLDATCVYALFPELGTRDSMTSIEFKVNFLAPGLEGRGPIDARADVLKSGRSLALVKAVATQGGKAIAEGLFTYVVQRDAVR